MSSSQIFTIGTALRRAEDNNVPVEVLVEGQWLRGDIAAMDGDGLVLVTPDRTQCVVRNAHISVVRLLAGVSLEDEEPSEPRAATYADSEPTAHTDEPSADDPSAQTFSWASAAEASARAASAQAARQGASPTAESDPQDDVADLVDTDRVVLGHPEEGELLVLGAVEEDDAFVLEAGADDGPLELESGAWTADAEPESLAEAPAEPESPAEPEGPVGKEDPADLVSRLLAESLREAGIEPEAALPEPEAVTPPVTEAVPEAVTEAEPEAVTEVEVAAEPVEEVPTEEPAAILPDQEGETDAEQVELLHPEKTPAQDDEPRIFALPAPTSTVETLPAPVETPAPQATPQPVAAAAEPEAAPEPEPAPEAPAAAAPADDWRSMLEGLRGEAAAPAPQAEPEKRRGRRLVMR